MRYHLYVNILQYLINSCVIIMGGQTAHNATGSGGGASPIGAWRTDAETTMVATIADANAIDPGAQHIALSSGSALAKIDVAAANGTGKHCRYVVASDIVWRDGRA